MEKIPVVQDFTPTPIHDGKLHVRLVNGRFQNLRRLTSWPLIALFFGLVWVQFDGQPWLLFSFEEHRIILFGNALSWRDLSLLAGLLIASACLLTSSPSPGGASGAASPAPRAFGPGFLSVSKT